MWCSPGEQGSVYKNFIRYALDLHQGLVYTPIVDESSPRREQKTMKESAYIILFPDGTMQFYYRQQDLTKHFQVKVRQFKAREDLPLYRIIAWVAKGWQNSTDIIEIH